MDRRDFLKTSAAIGGIALAHPILNSHAMTRLLLSDTPASNFDKSAKAYLSFVRTNDRAAGVKKALDLLDYNSVSGKSLFVKPNFNSADPAPGSTHNDVLGALIESLRQKKAGRITVGDRSGMGDTRKVMRRKDIFKMAEELKFNAMVFDELSAEDWEMIDREDFHWQRGFAVPKPVLAADGIIQTCCLKTHRYGGHFTMSLKNSVGLAAKYVPGDSYNYMNELHSSAYQRHMIAEINASYQPDLVVMDGIEAFVEGGPASGKKVNTGIIIAGTDRIAIDAVGVAILRYFGTTPAVSERPVFQQDQIARAVELGLGVESPDQIELIAGDAESKEFAKSIREILVQG